MPKRILLVDDEFSILFAYKKVLQRPDVVVDAVDSMEEAINLLEKNDYQVAILDLRLHGSTDEEGFELIDLVRGKYNNPKITIILITAYGNPEIKDRAYKHGADYYFEKPVSTNTIRNTLERVGITISPANNG